MALVGGDVAALMSTLGSSSLGPVFKFSVAFPFAYHYLGAVRHAYWDFFPEVLNNEHVEQSSILILGSGVAIGTIAAFI
jgi:succinate dehydrogenase/fumarate reductase cytochrome b subunit